MLKYLHDIEIVAVKLNTYTCERFQYLYFAFLHICFSAWQLLVRGKDAFSSLYYGAIREIGTLRYEVDAIIIICQAFSYKSHSDNI